MLGRILKGYLGVLRGVGFFLGLLAASAALGALVAWPLWRFATASRPAYSWFALACMAAGLAAFGVRAALRRGKGAAQPRRGRPRALMGLALVLLFAAGLCGVLLLAARGLPYLAVPALLALFFLVGWLAFARPRP
jgi:hypothetical protein